MPQQHGRAEASAPARDGAVVPPSSATQKPAFRPEVQGLRAVALMMVVCYHIWFGRVSGGVDIFLMISAFFLTGSLARALDSGRSLNPLPRWSHQFRRLVPAAAVVILSVLAVVWWQYPAERWLEISRQGVASATYWQNWQLASEAVDYYAADHSVASPLQHFWSLSVQGQVFILWPLIALAVGALFRKRVQRPSRVLFWVLAGIFALSLAYSVVMTAVFQSWAYFDTGARLYEFAFGGMLAIVIDRIRLSRSVRLVLGWLGLVAMLSCGFLLDVKGLFPGAVALWPVLSAAAIIVAGRTGAKGSVDWLLTMKPVRLLGDYSYAMYLWHWPVMITWLVVKGYDHVSPRAGLFVIGTSFALAWLTTRLVEQPLRTWKKPDTKHIVGYAVLAVLVSVAVVPAALWNQRLAAEAKAETAIDKNHPGANALLPGYVDKTDPNAKPLPELSVVTKQFAGMPDRCTGTLEPKTSDPEVAKRCRVSLPSDQEAENGNVLVIGDAHAQQLSPMIIGTFHTRGYRVVETVMGGCRPVPAGAKGSTEVCGKYNKGVREYIDQLKPKYIITLGTSAVPDSPAETLSSGFEKVLEDLTSTGAEVILVRDNPRFETSPNICLEEKGLDSSECASPRKNHFPAVSPMAPLLKKPHVHGADMTDSICTQTECPAVVGNMLVYLDNNHITRDYARSMAPAFEKWFAAEVEKK